MIHICANAVRFQPKTFSELLSKHSPQSPEMAHQRIFGSWVPDHYDKGEYDTQEVYEYCTTRVKAEVSFEKFCSIYQQSILIDLDGCDALIVQAGELVKELIPDQLPSTFTCDVGVCKPSKKLLVDLLTRLDARASECSLDDSNEKMRKEAQKLGFHTLT